MMTGFVHSLGRVNDDGVTYTCGPSGVAPNGQAGAMPESTRCATRTTMGMPPMSASGLLGRRVEASRAGMSTVMSADGRALV